MAKLPPYRQWVRASDLLSISGVTTPLKASCYITRDQFFNDVGDAFPLPPATCGATASGQRLLAVEENATNDRQRRDEVCLVMAVNDGGVRPILAQKNYTQPSAFSSENLLREARRQKQNGGSSALLLAAIAADLRRSRLLP
jgi:hypothetical protein